MAAWAVYALANVFGGAVLTLWLARFEKRAVLLCLMLRSWRAT